MNQGPTPVEAVYDGLLPFVGRRWTSGLGRIDRLAFQRYATATGEGDPRVWYEEAAARDGLAGLMAPPLFLTSVMSWGAGPRNDELRHDGVARTFLDELPLGSLRLMGGGQTLELVSPVVEGTVVDCVVELVGVNLKEGRSGQLVVLSSTSTFADRSGDTLVRCHEQVLAR